MYFWLVENLEFINKFLQNVKVTSNFRLKMYLDARVNPCYVR
jgi:hypothetical protein